MALFSSEGATLVVGASGGTGSAIAHTLAREGASLALTYRSNHVAALRLQSDIAAMGTKASLHALPHSDEPTLQVLIDTVIAEHGQINHVIYAAGPPVTLTHLSKVPPSQMARFLTEDTLAFYTLAHLSLPHLRQSRGSVVACTTTALSRYAPADGLSVIPKAGVEALIRAFAKEEGRYGVRANAVALGLIETGQQKSLVADGQIDAAYLQAAARATPLQRLGTAQDVAEAVAFLASHRASFITGEVLHVDGGYHV